MKGLAKKTHQISLEPRDIPNEMIHIRNITL